MKSRTISDIFNKILASAKIIWAAVERLFLYKVQNKFCPCGEK